MSLADVSNALGSVTQQMQAADVHLTTVIGLFAQLRWAMDGTEAKLKALDVTSKESIGIMEELNSLLGDKFPDVAKAYIENYKIMIQDVLRGSESIDQALGQLEALQAMLNRMGLKSGQMAQLDAFTKMFQELLRQLGRQQRRP